MRRTSRRTRTDKFFPYPVLFHSSSAPENGMAISREKVSTANARMSAGCQRSKSVVTSTPPRMAGASGMCGRQFLKGILGGRRRAHHAGGHRRERVGVDEDERAGPPILAVGVHGDGVRGLDHDTREAVERQLQIGRAHV